MPRRRGPTPPTFAPVDPGGSRESDFLDGTWTVREALAMARVRRETLYDEIRAGRIEASQPGRRLLVSKRSLARWLAARKPTWAI